MPHARPAPYWFLLLLWVVMTPTRAQVAAVPVPPALPGAVAAPAPPDELYLEVILNGEPSGLIQRFTRDKTGLRSTVENLTEIGFDPARFGLAGLGAQAELSLDALAGLSYEYDAGRQSIALRVSDALRTPYQVSARHANRAAPASATPGAVLNYDTYIQLGKTRSAALFQEFRYFDNRGVFSSTGNLTVSGPGKRYLRYDTFWNHSDPDTLVSFQLGDLVSSSLSWSRSLRIGGVQWRKNFELRPDLLTFPVAALGGSALVPSALSLYVNGVQQYNGSVPSGPFVLNQVAGINGAGQATVVTRDALGRSVSTTLPLYIDTRLLASGLFDYSFELGALRRGYGASSFSYQKSPVGSASVRYGASDTLTVEGHAEFGRSVLNGGAGALLKLGQSGVVNGSLSASAGRNRGLQASVGYQYVGPGFNVDAQSLRASRGYGDLASGEGSAVTLATDRISLGRSLSGSQSVALSYVGYRVPGATGARIASLSYSRTLGRSAFFSVSAFQDFKVRANRGFFVSLSMALGTHISSSANVGRQNGSATRTVSLLSAPDFAGGFGWGLQAGTIGDSKTQQAQLQYLGNYGQVSAFTQSNGVSRSSAVDMAGALVLMDGSLAAARQVGSGFALVSTDGVANIQVIHENRPIGVTDGSGHLLIPNLNAYGNNQIAIDTDDLAADARVRATRMNVVPKLLSGVLVRFPVERYSAASIIIHGLDGKPLASGLPVLHRESGAGTVIGYDGIAFIDNLGDDNNLLIGSGASRCAVRFAYRRGSAAVLPVIGPLVCGPVAGEP